MSFINPDIDLQLANAMIQHPPNLVEVVTSRALVLMLHINPGSFKPLLSDVHSEIINLAPAVPKG
jgi:hypothetical protein